MNKINSSRELDELEIQKLKCLVQGDNFGKLQNLINNSDLVENINYHLNNIDCQYCLACSESNEKLINTIKNTGLYFSICALSGISLISIVIIKEFMKKK